MNELPITHSPAPPKPAIVVRDDVPLEALAASDWDGLASGAPLLAHAFLSALHASGCASVATGWRPRYLTAWHAGRLTGAVPLYAKTHSYGEYVFDWAWADAFRRHGIRYYPKLVAAIPFTPATGSRLLARDEPVRVALLRHALAQVGSAPGGASSLHVLFPPAAEAHACARAGMIVRHGVQFRWENPGYRDFADFLAAMSHEKRKKVKQDRRRVAEAGVSFERRVGREIGEREWRFFHRCYASTYRAHHSTPYLSLEFFERIGATMPDRLLLVVASRAGRPLAAALDVFDGATLWGRYWGTAEYVPGLHFETCYYQAIDFCIERGIAQFEGGAQGVHKLARGFLPVTTYSAHAIGDPEFARAIAAFCARERTDVAHAVGELEEASPFRKHDGSAT